MNKNDNINKLLKLIKENPELDIVPMVDGELGGDDYAYWLGDWGYAEIDDVHFGDCGRVYFRSEDTEELVEKYCEFIYEDEHPNITASTPLSLEEDSKIEKKAERLVSNLDWETFITVKINLPR